MRLPLQIVFRNIGPSDAVRKMVEDRLGRLERHHGNDKLESCRVAVERRHRRHASHFEVHVSIKAPDGRVIVNQDVHYDQAHEDVYMAIQDAFDSVQRQLDEHIERGRSNGWGSETENAENGDRIRTDS